MSQKIKIGIIVGSTRNGRFGDKPAHMIHELTKSLENVEAEVFDLKEIDLPMFDSKTSPSYITNGDYGSTAANTWAEKIKATDAFIIVTPEYNHGYPAALKNALDLVFVEWANKPVGFVAYGSIGGGRAVEQLRQVAIELQMAPIRNAVHIMAPWLLQDEHGALKPGALDNYHTSAEKMLQQLLWWAHALKDAREKK